MAAFSRGRGPTHQLLLSFHTPRCPGSHPRRRQTTCLSSMRVFSSCFPLHSPTTQSVAAPTQKPKKPQTLPRRNPTSPATAPSSSTITSNKPTITKATAPLSAATKNPLLLQIARSQSPTLLYESASHFWMKFTSWSTTISCYAAAGINYYLNVISPAAGPWWVPGVNTVSCLAMAGMGSYFLFGSSNIIKSIRAVPTNSLSTLPPGTNPRLSPVLLEVAVKPLLPFRRKAAVMTVLPEQFVLQRRLFTPRMTEGQVRREQAREKAARQAEWEEDKRRLMTVPFRHMWKGAVAAWSGVKRGLTGGGFVKAKVQDRKCKLDVSTGWALDDGLALENIVEFDTVERPGRKA